MLQVSSEVVASPSLSRAADGTGPAFELKFLIDEAQAAVVEHWARRRLLLDPHGDAALDGAYRTTSLYSDTAELAVYHRTKSYKRRKFRVRRYGDAAEVFLERKSKWGDRVAKRRSAVAEDQLPLLAHPLGLVSWPGHWFHQRLLRRRLQPACQVRYQRTAFVGSGLDGPLRLTLDRGLRGQLTGDWRFLPGEGGLPLLSGQVVLEFKFRLALPAPFKELVGDLRLCPTAVSKYRLCRDAWGSASGRGELAHA